MALIENIPFSQFEVFIGDGNIVPGPEVFLPRCLLNAERGISIDPEFNDIVVPDCDDPDLPSAVQKFLTQLTAEATGSGMVNQDDIDYFLAWVVTGETRNVKVTIGTATVNFAAKMGSFAPGVSRNQTVEASISLMSTGAVTIT